ncbi:MAG: DUF4392 domain-containing protein [SAR324 cluster bacterium]|nr:DUF4392 domain-containing protein [SAR324 cluster bacterium]
MTSSIEKNAFEKIEQLIAQDPAGRNIAPLVQPGHLEAAARTLTRAGRVLITTGFFVPSVEAGETDGPPGAKALGAALETLGIPAVYVTDAWNAPYLRAIGAKPLHLYEPGLLERLAPSHLISVERVGRAEDGRYYNMRGEDISPYTEPVDELFLQAAEQGLESIGIGDGGNEIGMGGCAEQVRAHVANGQTIACVVATDYLIACGVSNWGAYGLVCALSLLNSRDLLPSGEALRTEVEAIVASGGVDGVTRRNEPTVDGQPLQASTHLLAQLRALL